jgi:hypothetical protein
MTVQGIMRRVNRSVVKAAVLRAGVGLATLLALSALVACDDSDGGSSETTRPVPTIPDWGDRGEGALLTGELRWDETGCVVAANAAGSAREVETPLVFPFGYRQLDDRHAIVNEDGQVVAEEGDTVQLGGGHHRAVGGAIEGLEGIKVRPCPDHEETFLVQFPIETASGAP